MANRAGGYALAETIELFHREGVWRLLGRSRTHDLVRKMLKVGHDNEAWPGLILQDTAHLVGLCCVCVKPAEEFAAGNCPTCYQEWYAGVYPEGGGEPGDWKPAAPLGD